MNVEKKMRGKSLLFACMLLLLLLSGEVSSVYATAAAAATNISSITSTARVRYDHRALVIDGKRRILISGSIHYPRSTPDMWPDLIQKSKDGGLDVIDTYVFWNIHEPVKGQYDFEGRKDLVGFIKEVRKVGLFVNLRIGPYVCAEWNFGGIPVWLHLVPGMRFRTDNEPFKLEMQRFTTKIVDMMKQEKLFASQGGPIILSQIENEYDIVEATYGPAGKTYAKWAASMATSLDTGVPWEMCKQADAPEPIINTCNGFYCDQFTPNSNKKPKIWSENWSGWFLSFGGGVPYRPVEDVAYAVARFFQKGGTFQNYYMYHGGTNFGHITGGPFIATSYDYDAPIDEYGIIRQPKWGHLRDLHKSIKLCEEALIATEPTYTSLGPNLEAHVYKTGSGACAAFIANTGTKSDAYATFGGSSYHIPAWSVSILPDCKNVVFNTAQINAQIYQPEVASFGPNFDTSKGSSDSSQLSESDWSWVVEPIGISKERAFTKFALLEQIKTTADTTDYLWYSTSLEIKGNESFLSNGSQTSLHISSLGHVLHVFVNGNLIGREFGNIRNSAVSLNEKIYLIKGKNNIDMLSVTVGLPNFGASFEDRGAGITGPVFLSGNGATWNLSSHQWTYQVGLKGEEQSIYANAPDPSFKWLSSSSLPKKRPLVWYKKTFDEPGGRDPVSIDFTGMSKGEAWVNGQSIGRYWPSYLAPQSGCSKCNFRGSFGPDKCVKDCGKPSQRMYHIPRSMLRPRGNMLVIFEEMGGDPTKIAFVRRHVARLCAHVSELHPPQMESPNSEGKQPRKSRAELHLECPDPQKTISSIGFASFGTPIGVCGNFRYGNCNSESALPTVQKACIGSRSCTVEVSSKILGDPCKGITKSLAVEATCV